MENLYTVKLPDIGEGVAEGEIIEWLKQPGDTVQQDEPVVVVMTDKATVELPSPHPGTLIKQYYKSGEKAPVHKPIYDLQIGATANIALPRTRQLARELGVEITMAIPTGKHGEITEADVRQLISAPKQLAGDQEKPLIGVRNLMAKRMTESMQNIPHFSYFEQADAVRLIQLRENVKLAAANEGINATFMPFFIRALSLTIDKYPILNSSIDMNRQAVIMHSRHNVGIAISTQHGLIVPVLKDVQEMKLQDIIRAYDTLKKKALNNSLSSSDMKEGTITISNYGVLGGGGRWATPIINYPEVAILAVARIQKQPVVKNDQVIAREVLNLSWSFDHRIIDGEIAAEASHFFGTLIANPAPLL